LVLIFNYKLGCIVNCTLSTVASKVENPGLQQSKF